MSAAAALGGLGSLLGAILFEVASLSNTGIGWVRAEQTLAGRHDANSWHGPGQGKAYLILQ